MLAIQAMLKLLDDRLKSTGQPLQEKVVPLLSALCQLARGDRIIRKYLRTEVLPPLGHVGTTRPEEGHLIRNELVRLMTSPLEDIKVCYKLSRHSKLRCLLFRTSSWKHSIAWRGCRGKSFIFPFLCQRVFKAKLFC